MPRKRKGSKDSTASAKSTTVNSSAKSVPKEPVNLIDQLFNNYANKSSGVIEPEGIESLCLDLAVEHTDVRILMLAWKMEAKRQGYFTLDEWRRALRAFQAETIVSLKKSLVSLAKEVRKESNFPEFHSYAFGYCLTYSISFLGPSEQFISHVITEDKQKTVDIESVCMLLNIVLGSEFPRQVEALVQYLQVQTDYEDINMDQWMGFYRFISEISFPDLGNYDPLVAWPSILDNFVDWMSSKKVDSVTRLPIPVRCFSDANISLFSHCP